MYEREIYLGTVQDLAQEEFGGKLDAIACDEEIFDLAFSYLFKLMPASSKYDFSEETFVLFCWQNRSRILQTISV